MSGILQNNNDSMIQGNPYIYLALINLVSRFNEGNGRGLVFKTIYNPDYPPTYTLKNLGYDFQPDQTTF